CVVPFSAAGPAVHLDLPSFPTRRSSDLVIDNLARLVDEHTVVYSMVGNAASPDNTKWYNARAYWYDKLREQIAAGDIDIPDQERSEEHTSELQSREKLVCRLLLEKKNKN